MKIAKEGDIIEWYIDGEYFKDQARIYGNTFQSDVVNVNHEEKHYDVYAPYGPDKVPFDSCRIIGSKK